MSGGERVPLRGWACRVMRLVRRDTDRGPVVVPVVPERVWRGLPTWRHRDTWRAAARVHPRLVEAGRRHKIATPTLLRVAAEASTHADYATGRGIAVAHNTIAQRLGLCEKTVQRGIRALEDLGLLVCVLGGSDMRMEMRMQIRDAYPRGDKRGTRSKLPSVYAAVLPAWLAVHLAQVQAEHARRAAQLATTPPQPAELLAAFRASHQSLPVDNPQRPAPPGTTDVHPPVGDTPDLVSSVCSSVKTTTFDVNRGKRDHRTLNTRHEAPPGPQQQKNTRHLVPLSPELEGWCRALRAHLPGYRDVSLHRIAPAMSRYVTAGLSTTHVLDGLNHWLAGTGTTWLTLWRTDQAEDKARYLVAMITRARLAGYIRPPTEPPVEGPGLTWRGHTGTLLVAAYSN